MDTISRALGIIALQSRLLAAPLSPRTISLDARSRSSDCAVETPLVDPVPQPLDDAPLILPAPDLVTFEDSWILDKDISLPCAAMADIATECLFILETIVTWS